ncbi:MAG: bis(5'-nucleosyl)-tetraphosphatase (symmetrical) YqeK [Anaerovoracaceae bacterium]|jgi:predicted HD superfamily hydrolase involved in NAD metabolism
MYSIHFDKLKEHIEKELTPKRMKHTLGVVSEAEKLALRYNVDKDKAKLAALCHDMARCRPIDSVELAHAKIAADLLKCEWGVEDSDILNAVAYHTTGRPGMSQLEKIIYLADAIEPGRDYPGVDKLRELAYEDLDKACAEVMGRTIEYVRHKGHKIDDNTIKAREELLAKERRADEQ